MDMKNLKKLLAIFLSIAMVMCSTLPSFASETETTVGASEEIVESSEDSVGASEETLVDETSRGERLSEPAEEDSRGERLSEPEEEDSRCERLSEPEEEPESTEETESTVGDDILSSHDETTESLSELKATKSEIVSKEELLGGYASTPWYPEWMFWKVEGDTIHFSSTDLGGYTIIEKDNASRALYYEGLADKSAIKTAVFDNEIYAPSCLEFFKDFSNLSEIQYLSRLKTNSVTEMSMMFYCCSSLTSLDLSGFDTSNVTSFSLMFYNCSSLKEILVLDSFVTTNATHHNNMFAGCTDLVGGAGTIYDGGHTDREYAHIDEGTSNPGYFTRAPWMYWYLTDSDTTIHFSSTDPGGTNPISNEIEVDYPMGSWKSSIHTAVFDNEINAVTCQGFFDGFTVLGTIDGIGNLKTNNVKYMAKMFYNCQGLQTLRLSLDTSNVEDMTNMFGNCQGLQQLSLSLDTPKVKTMNKMFENCEVLSGLDLSSFDTSSVTTMASMFKNCKALLALTLSSNFTTAEVTDMESMFESCERLNNPDLSSFNTSKVTNMKSMFKGCSELVKLDLTGFNTSNVYYMKEFLSGCSNIKTIDLSNFDTENVREMEKMFYGCSSLITIIASDKFSTISVTDDGADMFSLCGRLVGCYGTEAGTHSAFNKDLARIDEGTLVRGFFSSSPWMYWYLTDSNQTIHYTNTKPTSGDYEIMTRRDRIVYNRLSITDKGAIAKAEFDNNVTAVTCQEFFSGFSSMVDIVNLNKLDTQNVNSMGSMFVNCSQLVDLDLSNFNTSNVTSTGYMFYNCSSLTSLDLNKFDISNVTSTQNMFYGCSSLTKIIVSNSFVTTSVTMHNDMFASCTNLVGGAGTTYDGRHTNKEYARIDGGPTSTTPGYFTLYVPPAPPTPPAPYYPGGSSGSSGSSGGGGGGGGGGPVTEDAPAVTYLPYVKSIVGFANNLMSKWSQDAMSSKWKLSVTAENGIDVPLKNGFVLYTHISTQIVGNETVQTAANNTYVFDENGNMITGWVHTADGKIYFFENKKTSDEGKMIIGWKQIQGSWYCFGPDGEMYTNTVTPDGHPVGPDGKWRG